MIKILNDNKNNNLLNDVEYDHEDDIINSKYYSLTNRIKNEYIQKMLKNL